MVVMNSYTTPSDLHSQSSRTGVYLDHSAGILSFITSVKPLKPRLSSTESSRFSWTVCPGFGIYNLKASAKSLMTQKAKKV